MDVQMPEMDGLEATAAIRKREQQTGTHIPVIALTTHALKSDRERCLTAGMDTYLTKPIRADELFQTIESLTPAPASEEIGAAAAKSPAQVFDRAAALAHLLEIMGWDGEVTHVQEAYATFAVSNSFSGPVRPSGEASSPTRSCRQSSSASAGSPRCSRQCRGPLAPRRRCALVGASQPARHRQHRSPARC